MMQIPLVCFLTGLEKALKGNWCYKELKGTVKLLTNLIAL